MSDLGKYSLSMSLDDIDDLPSFSPWLTGAYIASMKITEKKVGDNMGWEVTFTHKLSKELVDKATLEHPEPKPGDVCNLFFQQTENGFRAFKKVLQPIGQKFGKKTAEECLAVGVQGLDNVLVILKRDWVEDKKKFYMRLTEYAIV